MEIEEYVMENFVNKILKVENGKKFVLVSDVSNFNFNDAELRFFLNLLSKNGIDYREDKIKRSDRSSLVRDQQVGLISNYGLGCFDEPAIADISYDEDGSKRFENYDELDKFLDEVFIPSYIHTKVNRSNIYGDNYFSIQFNSITKLRLSDDEIKHTIDYLGKQGIIVCGNAVMPEGEFSNYDFNLTYSSSSLPDVLDKDEINDLFIKLSDDGVSLREKKKIRKKLIEHNVRLVDYVLFRIHKYYNIDILEYRSYGYEGLINAVDNFDYKLGFCFSTFAYKCILSSIQKSIVINSDISNQIYFDFLRAQKIVEENFGRKYVVGDFDMLNEILDFLVGIGQISSRQAENIYFSETTKNGITNYLDITEIEDYITYDGEFDESVLSHVYYNDLKSSIEFVFDTLTNQEKEVLSLYFGFGCERIERFSEIARVMNLSPTRISHIYYRAFRKMRHSSRLKYFDVFRDFSFVCPDNTKAVKLKKGGYND